MISMHRRKREREKEREQVRNTNSQRRFMYTPHRGVAGEKVAVPEVFVHSYSASVHRILILRTCLSNLCSPPHMVCNIFTISSGMTTCLVQRRGFWVDVGCVGNVNSRNSITHDLFFLDTHKAYTHKAYIQIHSHKVPLYVVPPRFPSRYAPPTSFPPSLVPVLKFQIAIHFRVPNCIITISFPLSCLHFTLISLISPTTSLPPSIHNNNNEQ